ncbi:MAG: response regulator [Magnetococcales bacterium]|nr:response regulator [Magnetococcales bacterium]
MALNPDKYRVRFIEESREHLEAINQGILDLEGNGGNDDSLDGVFRAAHSIKGLAKILKFTAVSQVAHKLEDLLDALRQGHLNKSDHLFNRLFQGADTLTTLIDRIAKGEKIHPREVAPICLLLEQTAQGVVISEPPPLPSNLPSASQSPPASSPPSSSPSAPAGSKPSASPFPVPEPKPLPIIAPAATPLSEESPPTTPATQPNLSIRIDPQRLDDMILLAGGIGFHQTGYKNALTRLKQLRRQSRQHQEQASFIALNPAADNTTALESLAESATDLHRQIQQFTQTFREKTALLESMTHKLQAQALEMRMQPLSTLFDPLRRTVRDIAQGCGKSVRLRVEGGETEMDKKIIEKIGDPLTHMIRNAIDHGLEPPAERVQSGKPEKGSIDLAAFFEEGGVKIELSDDGRGIPLEKVKAKALEKNLVTREELETWSEEQILNLIFQPGFSTSAILTDLSGRGVGMDVVWKNIVIQMQGHIQVTSQVGKGTRFVMTLPATLAAMRVMLVRIADLVFGLPMFSLSEAVRLPRSQVMDVLDGQGIRVREQLITLVSLAQLMGLEAPALSKESDQLLVVIVDYDGRRFGLIVDELLDEGDHVIKPLPPLLKDNQWVSGVIETDLLPQRLINVLRLRTILGAIEADRSKSLQTREKTGQGKRILVVDDSPSTREIERGILLADGFQVDLAEDGRVALEKIAQAPYDLVVTDVEMPVMDGFSLTEHLRCHHTPQELPVVIVSSRAQESDRRRGIAAGANAYIVKGTFDQSNLLATVRHLVN